MKHVLIIEDEKSVAELERDYLEINSFKVSIENTGKSGLRRVLNGDIDLIILDLMLPDMDGFEICRELRHRIDIPILIVSAKRSDIDKIRGLGIGADDYITKPFSPNELVARVKAHLNRYVRLTRKRIEINEYIEYPGLKIDRAARRVFVGGEERFFTTKEFDLLTYLATHPNHVFSKDELFSAVWGMDSMGEIATVTVHIKKIRKKTENTNVKAGYIETVWGAGYRFRVMKSSVDGNSEDIVNAVNAI
nr:response regulator transcription factor [uncultured Anaerobutyricum sp.]